MTTYFRTFTGTLYTISTARKAYWGGDLYDISYGQTLQYTRLYVDYVPTAVDQMHNLAWMQAEGMEKINYLLILSKIGTLYYFSLATDYIAVQNLSTPVKYYEHITQGTVSAPICN